MSKETHSIAVTTSHDFFIETKGNPKRIFLLLHGYLLDGAYMFRKLKDQIPNDSLIIAPNGPFVVPVKKREKFDAKYAWYFFDPHTKNFYINYEPAAEYLHQVVGKYNQVSLPVTVIGYSQGGYLSPKVAEVIPEVDSVIGLACVFRNSRFEVKENVIYHQINSKDDLVVEIAGAKEEFQTLKDRGNLGEFTELKGSGHKIDEHYLASLKNYLANQ